MTDTVQQAAQSVANSAGPVIQKAETGFLNFNSAHGKLTACIIVAIVVAILVKVYG